jgi:hypothetical protein
MGVSRLRPFSHDSIVRRVLPFAGAGLLGLVVGLEGEAIGNQNVTASLITIACALVILFLVVFLPWDRFPEVVQAVPPVSAVIVFGYMLGTGSQHILSAPLVLVPIFWMALYHPRSHLLAGLAAMWALLPIVLLREANWAQTLFWPVASPGSARPSSARPPGHASSTRRWPTWPAKTS